MFHIDIDDSHVLDILTIIMEKVNTLATQAEVDAIVTQVTEQNAQLAALAASLTGIQSDIDTLVAAAAAGQPVNLTGLQTAVADLVTGLGTQVTQAQAIDAENPVVVPAVPAV